VFARLESQSNARHDRRRLDARPSRRLPKENMVTTLRVGEEAGVGVEASVYECQFDVWHALRGW